MGCKKDLIIIASSIEELFLLFCFVTKNAVAIGIKHFGGRFLSIVTKQKVIFLRQTLNGLGHLQ